MFLRIREQYRRRQRRYRHQRKLMFQTRKKNMSARLTARAANTFFGASLADLSPDEIKRLKYERRLMKNRESAQVSRVRRREYMKQLETDVETYKNQTSELMQELAKLREENDRLKSTPQCSPAPAPRQTTAPRAGKCPPPRRPVCGVGLESIGARPPHNPLLNAPRSTGSPGAGACGPGQGQGRSPSGCSGPAIPPQDVLTRPSCPPGTGPAADECSLREENDRLKHELAVARALLLSNPSAGGAYSPVVATPAVPAPVLPSPAPDQPSLPPHTSQPFAQAAAGLLSSGAPTTQVLEWLRSVFTEFSKPSPGVHDHLEVDNTRKGISVLVFVMLFSVFFSPNAPNGPQLPYESGQLQSLVNHAQRQGQAGLADIGRVLSLGPEPNVMPRHARTLMEDVVQDEVGGEGLVNDMMAAAAGWDGLNPNQDSRDEFELDVAMPEAGDSAAANEGRITHGLRTDDFDSDAFSDGDLDDSESDAESDETVTENSGYEEPDVVMMD
eukprot:Rmarinus@m.21494